MADEGHITGLGGVTFSCRDVESTRGWYREKLGIAIDPSWGGTAFTWREKGDPEHIGATIWAPFSSENAYFAPSKAEFMINFRVRDLDGFLAHLKSHGVPQIGEIDEQDYGRFAWILDPDGRKIELWEPKGEPREPIS